MTQRTQEEQLAALRAPFDPADIGKLPRAKYKNTDPKGECTGHANDRGDGVTCGKYHTLPAIHLDYVGHGALTKRLLDVDPMWTWEPVAYDEAGLPLVSGDRKTAELWIRLTVAGVTRIGVGTAPADQHELAKVLIGDALRNAGMRFGVALDLWVKG